MTQVYTPRAHARFQHLGYSSFAMVFIMQACSSAIFKQAFYYFIFDLFLSHFLFSAYMGYVSKQKGVMRDAMFFVMEACSFANFQKN